MNEFGHFQQTVWDYYRTHGRHDLPWRLPDANGRFDPYKIMVSEIMLQQTQVPRVIPKFLQFLERFPSANALAEAPLGEVLSCWSGLGYNRRAKFLWQAAGNISRDHEGQVPTSRAELTKLPGIGPNTAGAILTYAYNQSEPFIETNIRTVFIHHFFADHQQAVSDAAIMEVVEKTLPSENPREWYWALMDYGTYLKQTVGNLSRRGKGFARQAQFEGSKRQIRGKVLRLLTSGGYTANQLDEAIVDERLAFVLDQLVAEGLVINREHVYRLPGM